MKVNVEDFKRIVGLNIEVKRKRAKMTLEDLAEKLGVTSRSVQNYEKGKNLDMILAYKLSIIFDCKVDEFFLELDTTISGV
jgi:DNA-binding XRE family transcriptional regulator